MTTLRETLDELGELPPRKIYRLFMAEGIRGKRSNSTECPVALYLTRETDCPIMVSPWFARGPGYDMYELPRSIRTFIERFDVGFYRKLRDRG